MKATIKIEKEVELKTLQVAAKVRYWEDATINGIEDADGNLIPCRTGDSWTPSIDLETGKILNWEQGKTADIHFKVCDGGSYYLQDVNGCSALEIENDYVPSMLCPEENGYGDYIIMHIDENGFIRNWNPTLEGFIDEE